jgi:hypothetical protein
MMITHVDLDIGNGTLELINSSMNQEKISWGNIKAIK